MKWQPATLLEIDNSKQRSSDWATHYNILHPLIISWADTEEHALQCVTQCFLLVLFISVKASQFHTCLHTLSPFVIWFWGALILSNHNIWSKLPNWLWHLLWQQNWFLAAALSWSCLLSETYLNAVSPFTNVSSQFALAWGKIDMLLWNQWNWLDETLQVTTIQ